MTATLPRCAALYLGDGHAWYPARPTAVPNPDESDVLWLPTAVLPNPNAFRWAEPTEVKAPSVTLDLTAVAELIYGSNLDRGFDFADDKLFGDFVLAELDHWHCRLDGLIGRIAQ